MCFHRSGHRLSPGSGELRSHKPCGVAKGKKKRCAAGKRTSGLQSLLTITGPTAPVPPGSPIWRGGPCPLCLAPPHARSPGVHVCDRWAGWSWGLGSWAAFAPLPSATHALNCLEHSTLLRVLGCVLRAHRGFRLLISVAAVAPASQPNSLICGSSLCFLPALRSLLST